MVSLFPRHERGLEITQLPKRPDGSDTWIFRGGIVIVSTVPKFGTIDIAAEEAEIRRGPHRALGETSGTDREMWVEHDEQSMEAHLKGNVVVRQNQDKIAGTGEQRTIHAPQVDYDFVTDRLLATDAELEVAAPGLLTPIKVTSPRIELFHPLVRKPDGSLTPAQRCEIRAGYVARAKHPFKIPNNNLERRGFTGQ